MTEPIKPTPKTITYWDFELPVLNFATEVLCRAGLGDNSITFTTEDTTGDKYPAHHRYGQWIQKIIGHLLDEFGTETRPGHKQVELYLSPTS